MKKAESSSERKQQKSVKPSVAKNPATQTKRHAHIDIELFDRWVDDLDSATQETFLAFASDNNSLSKSYLCSFPALQGQYFSVRSLGAEHYPKPDFRKKLIFQIEEMEEDVETT